MAKSTNSRIKGAVSTAPGRASTSAGPNGSAGSTDADVARRAYDIYLARGGVAGHDVEDWLQAERELRGA